jgi:cellulose synthase/poly-beta-1,6-N-acetylglucosamine synthase-like glycosyltransferase
MKKKAQATKIAIFAFLYYVTIVVLIVSLTQIPKEESEYSLLRSFVLSFAFVFLVKYFIYAFVSPWYDVKLKWNLLFGALKNKSYYPKVSVLVPAWNEEIGVLETVKTLLGSVYRNLEIIVINDGSTDNSDQLMRNFLLKYDEETQKTKDKIDVLYQYKENGGKGQALNTAIEIATGEILVSIDADCIVSPFAISNFVKHFRDPKVMAAVGNVKIADKTSFLGEFQFLEFLSSFYFKKADSLFNTIYIIGGAAGAFRKEVFDTLGPYNHTNITEDIELSMRIQDAGMKIVYIHDAIVYTEGASTLSGLIKQRHRWMKGRFETFGIYRHLFFTTNYKHNKLVGWFTLPMVILSDIRLFFEPFFFVFVHSYAVITHDMSAFVTGFIVMGFSFCMYMIFDERGIRKSSYYITIPVTWIIFYLSTFVEYNAFVRSGWSSLRKKEVIWQKWERVGCADVAKHV